MKEQMKVTRYSVDWKKAGFTKSELSIARPANVIDIDTCIEAIENCQIDDNIVVTVSDNGPGISDDNKAHIFEMFFIGNNKIADGRRGLGLGLALCKSIIDAHNGTITLSDNTPHGCIFTFTLPAERIEINE